VKKELQNNSHVGFEVLGEKGILDPEKNLDEQHQESHGSINEKKE